MRTVFGFDEVSMLLLPDDVEMTVEMGTVEETSLQLYMFAQTHPLRHQSVLPLLVYSKLAVLVVVNAAVSVRQHGLLFHQITFC